MIKKDKKIYKQKSPFPSIIENGIEYDFIKSYSILIKDLSKNIAKEILKYQK